jgi:hypothetical protein
MYASSNATKPIPATAVLPDKFMSNLSSSSLCAAIPFMMQFSVQREGAAHPRDRLTLRLLRTPTYGRGCRLANGIYRPRIHIVRAFPDE